MFEMTNTALTEVARTVIPALERAKIQPDTVSYSLYLYPFQLN